MHLSRRAAAGVALLLAAWSCALATPMAAANPADHDPSFGSNGVVQTPLPSTFAHPAAVAIASDGSIVVAGTALVTVGTGTEDAGIVVRYRPNGSLDRGFGSGGIATTRVGDGYGLEGMTLQRDGKIVVVGASFSSSTTYVTLVRYNLNGSLDASFGSGGIVRAPASVGKDASAVAQQPDGKLVVGGTAQGSGFMVARYSPDGRSLDTSFDGDGVATVPGDVGGCGTSSESGVDALALAADGAIIASGQCGTSNTGGVLRFRGGTTPDNGAFDSSFGTGGAALAPFSRPNFATGLARLPDGRLLLLDQIGFNGSGASIGLVRYSADGATDGAFGSGGSTSFGLGTPDTQPAGLALAGDGKILVAASDGKDNGVFALVRRNPDGSPDRGFGVGGQVLFPTGQPGPGFMSQSGATALAIQKDNKVVEVGNSHVNGKIAFTLVRFGAAERITKLRIRPSKIKPARRGPSVVSRRRHAKKKYGALVSYSSSEPGTATFKVQRIVAGRLAHGRCVRPSRKVRRRKHCVRYVGVGSFSHSDSLGVNRFRFTGRLRGRSLSQGRYRLVVLPRNEFGPGPTAFVDLRVVR